MKQIYHVTCNTDDNFVQHCCAMLCSLCENNRDIHLCIHILHSISAANQQLISELIARYDSAEVVFHEINEADLQGVNMNEYSGWTVAVYYRILLPTVLPVDVHRVLYLDCDIIVRKSVKPLFDLDLTDMGVAACRDNMIHGAHHREQISLQLHETTFCSGIMMINLDYWREHDAQRKLVEFSRKEKGQVYYPDQDALNYVFRGHWFVLPPKWNKTPLSIAPLDRNARDFDVLEYDDPPIIHYAASIKPWQDIPYPDRKHYLKYLKLSGYPNPKVTKTSASFKRWVYPFIFRYYVNRYVHPLVPDVIEIPCMDLLRLFRGLYLCLFRRSGLKGFMLKQWIKKYR